MYVDLQQTNITTVYLVVFSYKSMCHTFFFLSANRALKTRHKHKSGEKPRFI